MLPIVTQQKFGFKYGRISAHASRPAGRFMGTEGKQYVWTIEHIFPQGENFPASWVQMIADGDAGLAKGHRETYAHCPGNLTISGYNSNKNFTEMQSRTTSQGRKFSYNNGLYLNETLATETSRTIKKIQARTEQLVQEALGKYSLATITE